MTDDLNTFQPPPLPVGPISAYNLEEASEAFERAYIDRVQHLCDSAREAAQRLDVSAATLARRLRKEGAADAP
jgi:transcriptional regulator of aromatic amino acid metabolism